MLVARKASCHVANLCLFDQFKANLANVQPENLQNVQEMRLWLKTPGVNGLSFELPVAFNLFSTPVASLLFCG